MTTQGNGNFIGRQDELKLLIDTFEDVAEKKNGPKILFLVAETGVGKTRLVQALYHHLSNSPKWDPEENNYWPNTFNKLRNQMRTVPDMADHTPTGSPNFLWLGVRWHDPDVRNTLEYSSVVPELQSQIECHVDIIDKCHSLLARVKSKIQNISKENPIDTAESLYNFAQESELIGIIPGVSWVLNSRKIFIELRKFVPNSNGDVPNNFDNSKESHSKKNIEALFKLFSSGIFEGEDSIPVILWLDDAQWIDEESFDFLNKLFDAAIAKKWPLMVVATHWEHIWLKLKNGLSPNLYNKYAGSESTTIIPLAPAKHSELYSYIYSTLPGLSDAQKELLVRKAGGNYLTMVENIGELISKPRNFLNEDITSELTSQAVTRINDFKSNRHDRITQRFNSFDQEIQDILGWSSFLGLRFTPEVIYSFSKDRLSKDPYEILDLCIDPYAILGAPSRHTYEFRDQALYEVAKDYARGYLTDDEKELIDKYKDYVSLSINNSFDGYGEFKTNNQNESNSIVNFERDDAIAILTTAIREYPLITSEICNGNHIAIRALALWTELERKNNFEKIDIFDEAYDNLRFLNWNKIPESIVSRSIRRSLAKACSRLHKFTPREAILRHIVSLYREDYNKDGVSNNAIKLANSLQEHARCLEDQKNIKAANNLHQKALELYPISEHNNESYCHFLNAYAHFKHHFKIHNAERDVYMSRSKIVSIYENLQKENNDTYIKLKYCHFLSQLAEIEPEPSLAIARFDSCIKILRCICEESQDQDALMLLVKSLNIYARFHLMRGSLDIEKALILSNEEEEIVDALYSKDNKNKILLENYIHCLQTKATTYHFMGNHDMFVASLKKALKLNSEKLELNSRMIYDEIDSRKLLNTFARQYKNLGLVEDAAKLIQESLSISNKLIDLVGMSRLPDLFEDIINLQDVDKHWIKTEEAIQIVNKLFASIRQLEKVSSLRILKDITKKIEYKEYQNSPIDNQLICDVSSIVVEQRENIYRKLLESNKEKIHKLESIESINELREDISFFIYNQKNSGIELIDLINFYEQLIEVGMLLSAKTQDVENLKHIALDLNAYIRLRIERKLQVDPEQNKKLISINRQILIQEESEQNLVLLRRSIDDFLRNQTPVNEVNHGLINELISINRQILIQEESEQNLVFLRRSLMILMGNKPKHSDSQKLELNNEILTVSRKLFQITGSDETREYVSRALDAKIRTLKKLGSTSVLIDPLSKELMTLKGY